MPGGQCHADIAGVIADTAGINTNFTKELAGVNKICATDPAAANDKLRQLAQQVRQGQFPGVPADIATRLDGITCS